MPILTHIDSQPFQHFEIEAGVWFYMNHVSCQEEHSAHSHSYLELAFILGGRTRHVAVKGEAIYEAGSLIVIPRGAWHAYFDCENLELINCLISPQMLGQELAWLEQDEELGALLGLRQPLEIQEVLEIDLQGEHLIALRNDLQRLETAYMQAAHRTKIVSLLLQSLEVFRSSVQSQFQSSAQPEVLHPSVRRTIELFRRSINSAWTLDELADQLQLNPSYLVRLFRAQIGLPPMKYLARIRAERAANLLLSTQLRVGEIGSEIGWADPKVFARNFQQHFGQKASDYRKKMLCVRGA